MYRVLGEQRDRDRRMVTRCRCLRSASVGGEVSRRVLITSSKTPLDTSTATGRPMLAVISALGQAERDAVLERQREGMRRNPLGG